MAGRDAAKTTLPTSHVFITVARGPAARTFMTRSSIAFAVMVATPLLGLWLAASTLYLAFHDDVVTSLMLRQRDMQYAYEDKLAALRSQINHEASRQLVSQRSFESKLDELTTLEAQLQTRSGIVAQLTDQAGRFGKTPLNALATEADETLLPQDKAALAIEPADHDRAVQKPRPEAATVIAPPDTGSTFEDRTTSAVPQRLSELSDGLDRISLRQEHQIAVLNGHVRSAVTRYRDALAVAGLSESRFSAGPEQASGGPFVPLARDDASPFTRAAVGVQLSLGQAHRLSTSIAKVPFSRPLDGDPEITSPFGARVDPFLGRPAMHTGIDLAENSGTEVRATAPGRVVTAGPVSGYGTMIEIDHGSGLSTRYAHLSGVDVSIGQVVRLGETIGRVGATGRATGPHLHYETRIDGEAVDPLRFLAGGQRLAESHSAL